MTEPEIFELLLRLGETSQDPEGVVAACLVRDGHILAAKASSDDGRDHAEYLTLKEAGARGLELDEKTVLYTTLEPCSDLPAVNDGTDCVTWLLRSGIRQVVFAARDVEHSARARERCEKAGVTYRQIGDPEIIRRSQDLFNRTLKRELSSLRLPRRSKLETDT